MRAFILVLVSSSLLGCGGFHAVSRGEWRLVYANPEKRDADSKLAVITREAFDIEVTEGHKRVWNPTPGYKAAALHQLTSLELKVGEIQGVIVDEKDEAQVLADGDAVTLFWSELEKRDAWDGDHDVTIKQSTLFIEAKRAGKATVRIVRGSDTHDVPVTVK